MSGDKPDAASIVTALSSERLAPYLRAAGVDLDEAVRLYEWNRAVSGALYEALGILEVVLRNALSTQLAAHHGTLAGHWYDDPLGVLSDFAHEDIAAARRRGLGAGRNQLLTELRPYCRRHAISRDHHRIVSPT